MHQHIPTPDRVLARNLSALADGAPARLAGWVHRRRTLKSVTFLVVRDRSGLAQVVVRDPAAVAQAEALTEESVVSISGTVSHNPDAPGGAELVAPAITVLTEPAAPPPAELWRPTFGAGLPTRLDHAAVTLRHPRHRAAWELAAASMRGFRCALGELGFTEVMTPKLVETATESGANVFELDYFGRPAYLAQSPQFYKQMLVGVFERVFEVGPVFRAEPHDTVRHLAQYTSLDAELGFIHDHRDVLAVLRSAIAGMVASIETYAAEAAALLGVQLPRVPDEFPVIHFRDALARVGADPDEPDLSPAHERALGEWARAAYGSDFLAVEGYPMTKRPFYTHPWGAPPPKCPPKARVAGSEDTFEGSNSFDLLFRGLELTTGGQRLHRPEDYAAAVARAGIDPTALGGYLDAFRHGMPPHGGFAIGLERWVARVVGAENVREVALFPRDLHRLAP
ncbi:aspartyl-tRNA synthetase [Intrasporangium chromatireducens Q5-1]|uniref:Aspartate--tRNA(Asp/Asn) ligase n=1 Tax=Intrasporangium chromatireducens Q5-1 TaxID=584657 RepID=W9GJ08_9MICO|nr:aspartate--tRNA(Asn) ligase [Intrasporangium chromatireducens]EWT06055.1 aspartyl-tRNA synthetase [Intrasporangium chromatireducens Q5-1]